MTIRTRLHRHERIAKKQLKTRLETLANSESFAPNQPRTSYLVSAPSKERGRLGYQHYKKQLRRLCTFHGEHHKEDTKCSHQGVKPTFKRPTGIINLTDSEVGIVRKFKPTEKKNQPEKNVSFGYDFRAEFKKITTE